jgi:acetyl esterase/lipase
MARLILIAVVALLVVAAGVVARWPLRVLSALTSRAGYALRAGVAYGALPAQRLDVYTPDAVAAAAPVVIFFHGGGWAIGNKDEYRFVGEALATAGIIVVIPNYRLSPPAIFPDFMHDGAAAVAWAAHEFAGHPLFLAGHSAGAHIATLLALDGRYLAGEGVARSAIAGAIGLSGPYDFLPLTEARYQRVFPESSRADSQPIRFVDGNAPPMLLVTGDADRTVKPGNTTRLADAIVAKGGRATVNVYPGVGHLGTMLALARILPLRGPPVRGDILAFIASVGGG